MTFLYTAIEELVGNVEGRSQVFCYPGSQSSSQHCL